MRLKFPRAIVLKLSSYVNLVLLCVFCTCLGVLGGLFLSISATSKQMKQSVLELNAQTEKLITTQEHLRLWKGLVDENFKEQRGKINRLEYLMRVPRSERTSADIRYRMYNYGKLDE